MAENKQNKRPNVPPLRFPEFTEPWERKKLSNFTERVTRKNKGQTNLPLTISAQYGLVDQISFFNNKVASADMSNYYLLKRGEFTYNKSYSSDYPLGAVKRLDLYDMGALSTLYICFKIAGDINSDYLVHYFESPKWHRGVYEIAGEGARNHGLLNIAVGDYFETQHYLPCSLKEQEKIASMLNLIQRRIEVQNKLIEDLQQLKSALYQRVFLSMRGQAVALSNIADIIKGKQINGTELFESGDYYVMNGGIVPSGYYNDFNTPANTISISEGGNSCGYVQFNDVPFWSGGHCYTLQITNNQIGLRYLFHFLKYREQDIMALRIGSGLPNIQKKDLERFQILIPTVDKQQRYAKFFDYLQHKEDIEVSILNQWQLQKQYLLGQMFI